MRNSVCRFDYTFGSECTTCADCRVQRKSRKDSRARSISHRCQRWCRYQRRQRQLDLELPNLEGRRPSSDSPYPVQIRRIEKAGYEVFNLEAVEQWIIAPKMAFQLVICKSEKIKALCDLYNQAASENYSKQLQAEKDRLAADRKAGRLKEEEYQAELQKTEDLYAQQLENLDLYVEKFAHFDLSEMSKQEQEIIELVQKGMMDEAITKYEQMDLLSKYQAQSKDIQQIRTTQDSLTVIRAEKVIARDSLKSTIDFMENVKKQ